MTDRTGRASRAGEAHAAGKSFFRFSFDGEDRHIAALDSLRSWRSNELESRAGTTLKLWLTGFAGSMLALPACEASILQVPADNMVAVVPTTEQMEPVLEDKLTGSCSEEVALSVSVAPTVCSAIVAKWMV